MIGRPSVVLVLLTSIQVLSTADHFQSCDRSDHRAPLPGSEAKLYELGLQAAGLEGDVAAAVAAVQRGMAGGLAAARGLLQDAQVCWHIHVSDRP